MQAQVVLLQQTPRHGEGVQVPPQKKMLGRVQVRRVWPVVQAQVVELQQTPRQGLGVQVPPQ